MACFISSNDNRFYVALESTYATVPPWTASQRCTGVQLQTKQTTDIPVRRDKTGTRTYRGLANRLRRRVEYQFHSYLAGREEGEELTRHGAFFQAALGSTPRNFGGGVVAGASGSNLAFVGNHGLVAGQAVAGGSEIRFVAAIPSAHEVVLNAPFTTAPGNGESVGASVTYAPAAAMPSLSIGDYWDPATAVQRVICGAVADRLEIKVNGDFHEFVCSGPAADIIDTASFESGQGGVTSFPAEPAIVGLVGGPIPGHLGQIWLGVAPNRMYTLLHAAVKVRNNATLRSREFGSLVPRCFVPGPREVTVEFSLSGRDDEATKSLYEAARQRTPVSMMLQLGEKPGQLCGVFLRSFIPEVPEFDDQEHRLTWKFSESRAQGDSDDEIAIAFA